MLASDKLSTPRHVAIIMDGNGRWAKQREKPRIAGHREGVTVLQDVVQAFSDCGTDYLTLFAFSSENWRRPKSEVVLLMRLFSETLENELDRLHHQGVCLRFIGDFTPFSKKLKKIIAKGQALTSNNTAINVIIAMNYGGRWDITQSCQKIIELSEKGIISATDVTEQLIDSNLSTSDLPAVDLLIRTGGDQRISNFLLWQCAYAELIFVDRYWPDFDKNTVLECIDNFSKRQRRYGKTSEQVTTEQMSNNNNE